MTGATCGTPHYRYTESLCTEPAGHYVRERDPHAAPLIIDGRERGGLAWDEPERHMPDRHTVNTITSDALDALYEQIEAGEATESQRQLATARAALASATTRAARAEAVLTRVRDAAHWTRRNYPGLHSVNDRFTAALDEPAPAATEATEPARQPQEHDGTIPATQTAPCAHPDKPTPPST